MIIGFIKSKFQYIWHYFFLHLAKSTVARLSVSKNEGWGFLKTDGRLSAVVSSDLDEVWSADDFFVEATKLKVSLNDPSFFMTFLWSSSVKRQALLVARWLTHSRSILEESYNLKPVEPRPLIGCQCWIVFRYGKRVKKIKWNSYNMCKSKKKTKLFNSKMVVLVKLPLYF